MSLNRAANYGDQALGIRKVYRKGFRDRTITAVVRPGDRSSPKHKNYIPDGVPLPVRFIKGPGRSEVGALGNYYPDDGTTIRRTEVIVKRIQDLTPEDLHGTAPDTSTQELVQYHLATIYDTDLPSLSDTVTIWRFKYLADTTELNH